MTIKSFTDLDVYNNSYQLSVKIIRDIITRLPKEERFDLVDQMRRACKAIPRLIAEGYAKKHHKNHFRKYLDDAMGECNEMVVCLSHCKDIYGEKVTATTCDELIDQYDKVDRQLYKLNQAWKNFV